VAGDRAEALAELERLYAVLPDLACKGLCGHSCAQHVDASTVERDRLVRVHGLDLDARTPDLPARPSPAPSAPPAAAPSIPTAR